MEPSACFLRFVSQGQSLALIAPDSRNLSPMLTYLSTLQRQSAGGLIRILVKIQASRNQLLTCLLACSAHPIAIVLLHSPPLCSLCLSTACPALLSQSRSEAFCLVVPLSVAQLAWLAQTRCPLMRNENLINLSWVSSSLVSPLCLRLGSAFGAACVVSVYLMSSSSNWLVIFI